MALHTIKGCDIPKGQVPLTRKEAVTFQLDIISTLAPAKYSCFVKYGPSITSTLGISTSIFIGGLYRSSVKIGNINRIYTSIPLTIAPALIHLGLHKRFVRDDIIIQKWACTFCYQMRSAIFQVFFGVLLPIATSAIAAFATARRLRKPDVPALNNSPEIYKFFLKKTRPFSRTLSILTVVHLVVGAAVAQAETVENNYFNKNVEFYIAEYEKKQERLIQE